LISSARSIRSYLEAVGGTLVSQCVEGDNHVQVP